MKSGLSAVMTLFAAIMFVIAGGILLVLSFASFLSGSVQQGILSVIPAVLCVIVGICMFITFKNKLNDKK